MKGSYIALIASSLLISACSYRAGSADHSVRALGQTNQHHSFEGPIKCVGVNTCRGMSECGSATNTCRGQNECKTQGWITLPVKECEQKGGSVAGSPS